jgi:hypothetical protein
MTPTECSSTVKVPWCSGTYPLGFESSTWHWYMHFPEFNSGFNRHYSFIGRRRARRLSLAKVLIGKQEEAQSCRGTHR